MDNTGKASRKTFHFIYKTTCLLNGKHYYGMHSTDTMDDGYMGSGKWVRRSIKKHGIENHFREVVEDCSEHGREFLRERERFWVNPERLRDPLCMNFAIGGGSAPIGNEFAKGVRTDEQKKRMSEGRRKAAAVLSDEQKELRRTRLVERNKRLKAAKAGPFSVDAIAKRAQTMRGRTRPVEVGQKISRALMGGKRHLGIRHTEEAKARMSMAQMGKKHSDETRVKISASKKGKPSSRKGSKHTEESRRKMSESQRGRHVTDDVRRRISEKLKGRKKSDETRRKISEAMRRLRENSSSPDRLP